MRPPIQLRFDRGTICVDGIGEEAGDLPGVLWDERTLGWRAPAYLARTLAEHASTGGGVEPPLPWSDIPLDGAAWEEPPLREYQKEALDGWEAFGRRGVVVLPTGGGKTRVAVAAMGRVRKPAAVLCPTRALLDQWTRELARWYRGDVGIVGDGNHRLEPVTVLTFESAYRHMDTLGDRFSLVVVDEVHHFGSGARDEALEMCAAPMRLGASASWRVFATGASVSWSPRVSSTKASTCPTPAWRSWPAARSGFVRSCSASGGS